MKKELQIVRLTTGEELVCEVTEFPEHQVRLSDVAIIIPTEGGIGMMYFMPYADLGEGIVIDEVLHECCPIRKLPPLSRL